MPQAWLGEYIRGSDAGRRSSREHEGNFIRSVPMIAIVTLIFLPTLHLSDRGIPLAVLSGALASGVGYTIWYTALKHHTATRAAVLQLPVPLLTAVLGIILLGEAATLRLSIASALVLGGIAAVVLAKGRET